MEHRKTIYYTMVDTGTQEEHRVLIELNTVLSHEPTVLTFPIKSVSVDPQQLAELGHLLIALSHHDYDKEPISELIEGYGIKSLVPMV